MKEQTEDEVRARLMALKASLEQRGNSASAAPGGRVRLGPMAHQERSPTGGDRSEALKRVRLALERLDTGTYAICVRCGGKIGPALLSRDPAALSCAKCSGDQQ